MQRKKEANKGKRDKSNKNRDRNRKYINKKKETVSEEITMQE